MKQLSGVIAALILFGAAGIAGATTSNDMYPSHHPSLSGKESVGIVKVKSRHSVAQTVERLTSLIKEKGLLLVATVNHTANAQKVGLKLPPTVLLIFGNPKIGTPLMQAQRTIAIDLPQKMLVWEDAKGQTWIAYNRPQYLEWRDRVRGEKAVFQKMEKALSQLSKQAAS